MGRSKKSDEAVVAAAVKKVAGKKKAVEEDNNKKKRRVVKKKIPKVALRRHIGKTPLEPYYQRICVGNGLPKIDRDAIEVIDNAYNTVVEGIQRHIALLLDPKKNKSVTTKCVQRAFLGYMEECGVSDSVTTGGINHSRDVLKAITSGEAK